MSESDSTKEIYQIMVILNFLLFRTITVMSVIPTSWQLYKGLAAPESYCNGEEFNTQCLPNEVVVMDTAFYGRMEIGRCVFKNMGYLGCQIDVLRMLDRKCSGQTKCQFPVTDKEITDLVPCSGDLKTYLKASYSCLKALHVRNDDMCKKKHYSVNIGDHTVNLVSRLLAENSECPGTSTHWMFEAQSGQQLNISVIDFNWYQRTQASQVCRTNYFAKITDISNHKTITLCSNGEKYRNVTITSGYSATVQIPIAALDLQQNNFVLSFEALGCPNLVAPPHAWLRRNGVDLVVGCRGNKHTWHLKCKGTRWQGVIGNCTQEPIMPHHLMDSTRSHSHLQDTIVVVICGVALVLCTVIVTAGVVCFKRMKAKEPRYLPASRDGKSHTTYSSYRYDTSLSSEPDTISMTSSPYRHQCLYVDPSHTNPTVLESLQARAHPAALESFYTQPTQSMPSPHTSAPLEPRALDSGSNFRT